jgi:cystathionine beta-lyase/cystathionine gamma-synthase
MSEPRAQRVETQLIHAGEIEPVLGAVTLPVFQSANFVDREEDLGDYGRIRYMRLSNLPNHAVLHGKLAALEGGEAALVTSSGMAAISTTLLTVLKAGDHLLAQDVLYGGSRTLLTEDLPRWGIEVDFLGSDDPREWARKLQPSTRAVYVETITNPLLDVIDHEAVVRFARDHGLVSLVDNTVATPLFFRPLQWGYDLVLHSATKYLNGHSDIVAGAVVGSAEWVDRIRQTQLHLGGSLDTHAASLLHRGLKTLAVRVRSQAAVAQAVAEALADHPAVEMVRYPGLAGDASHDRARLFFDGYGALVTFHVKGGAAAAAQVSQRLRWPKCAASFGGVESLVTRPATTSHAGLSPEARAGLGIAEGLIRVSVGLEAAEDLVADFRQALDSVG